MDSLRGGRSQDAPLARLREAHELMRTFLPLKVGATMTGPGSFRLAGEIADGVHVAFARSSGALAFAAQDETRLRLAGVAAGRADEPVAGS